MFWGLEKGDTVSLVCCPCSLLTTQELYNMTAQEMSPGNMWLNSKCTLAKIDHGSIKKLGKVFYIY